MLSLLHSFQGEWLKKKRSLASWLTITGGIFIPVIILVSRFDDLDSTRTLNSSGHLWEFLYNRNWQFMGFFLLPMGVILATSLITQLEFKNNTWKQLFTTPQTLTTIFCAKLVMIVLMMLQFFVLFNIGIYLEGIIPGIIFKSVSYLTQSFPLWIFIKGNAAFFVDCLPIIALQYALGLQLKNFLAPLGIGLALYVAAMISTLWKYGYWVPYGYCALNFTAHRTHVNQNINIHFWAIGYFLVFSIVGYILYITKKQKG